MAYGVQPLSLTGVCGVDVCVERAGVGPDERDVTVTLTLGVRASVKDQTYGVTLAKGITYFTCSFSGNKDYGAPS